MRRVPAYALAIATGAAFTTANAQFSVANPAPSKITVTSATSGASGGFLGSDACTSAHTPAGSGSVSGVAFNTGTTGTQGQNEANCYAFGSTTLTNDVWYDWNCTASGNAILSTCGQTGVDTKIASYPGSPGACPADGTSLACNDDACGLQTTITWPVTTGSTYTIQVGTFPGAAGGSGTFSITQAAPPPCGQYDDGTTENALGLTAGGEIGWLHGFNCFQTITSVSTAYGTPLGTPPPNGTHASIHVYEDSDCDNNPATPAGGMAVRWSLDTTVTNTGTDILNNYPAPGGANVNIPSRCSWIMATSGHTAGQFPAPMDQTNPTPAAWVAGNTTGPNSMDTNNLNNNALPPLQMQAIGFPAAFLLRATGTESGGNNYPQVCFGGSGCPCGNNGDGQGGCQHTVGTGGTTLAGSGSASIGGDTFVLTATRTRNAPGIFFQANNTLGAPPAFGDGLRCCGVNVVRIGTYLAAGNTTNTDTGNLIGGIGPPISDHPGNSGLNPGDTRCYQYWHRDPPTGVCGSGFNLSNAVQATWTP